MYLWRVGGVMELEEGQENILQRENGIKKSEY